MKRLHIRFLINLLIIGKALPYRDTDIESQFFNPRRGLNMRMCHWSSEGVLETESLARCLDYCMSRRSCSSVNFEPATMACQLLQVNSTTHTSGLRSEPGMLHVDLEDWLVVRSKDLCSARPCGTDEACVGNTMRDHVTCFKTETETDCEEIYLVSGQYGVSDSQLTASSVEYPYAPDQPYDARLESNGGWDPATETNSYIQVRFNKGEHVRGVVTQGSGYDSAWVTEYTVAVSDEASCSTFQFVLDPRTMEAMVFRGNCDTDTPITNRFKEDILATCLRVYPLRSHGYVTLRFDVIGCLTL